jgi:hypothetical protein
VNKKLYNITFLAPPKRPKYLPENNASLPIQDCEAYRCRITIAACAVRYAQQTERYDHCRQCKDGRRNYMRIGTEIAASPKQACGIVVRNGQRMITRVMVFASKQESFTVDDVMAEFGIKSRSYVHTMLGKLHGAKRIARLKPGVYQIVRAA